MDNGTNNYKYSKRDDLTEKVHRTTVDIVNKAKEATKGIKFSLDTLNNDKIREMVNRPIEDPEYLKYLDSLLKEETDEDRVKVIRCKDCMYSETHLLTKDPNRLLCNFFSPRLYEVPEDGYCHRGRITEHIGYKEALEFFKELEDTLSAEARSKYTPLIKKALNREIAVKPAEGVISTDEDGNQKSYVVCPHCLNKLRESEFEFYCTNCGQAIEWEH